MRVCVCVCALARSRHDVRALSCEFVVLTAMFWFHVFKVPVKMLQSGEMEVLFFLLLEKLVILA